MTLPPNSSLLTIISFGLGLLFLGGELAKKRQDKAEIKEIQKQQNELLAKLEESRKIALQNEQRALAHIDSIYQVLDVLPVQEPNVHSGINRLLEGLARKTGTSTYPRYWVFLFVHTFTSFRPSPIASGRSFSIAGIMTSFK